MKSIGKAPVLALVMILSGFVGGWMIAEASPRSTTPSRVEARAERPGGETPRDISPGRMLADQLSSVFETASAEVSPAVVPVFSEQTVEAQSPFGGSEDELRQFFGDDFFRRFFGAPPGDEQGGQRTVRGLGSGVIVSSDGYILTNNHVVDHAEKLTVVLQDNRKLNAKVVGTDPETDVAVIKVDATGLPAATLGDSDGIKVGQWVLAVGNPFQLMHTVTAGIVSAKGRSSVGLADFEDFIQTDASINPGNSGGALVNLDGEVIGINTAISSPSGGNVGIGFAIPINMARHIMDDLIKNGKVTRGYLGVMLQDIDDNLAKALKLDSTKGALVANVTTGSPGDRAGLKRGDVIVSYNGKPVEDTVQIRNEVAQAAPGTVIQMGVLRDGRKLDLNADLGVRPEDLGHAPQSEQNDQGEAKPELGLSIQTLTPDIARQLGYDNEHGALITGVEPGGPAEGAGLQRGDLILEADRSPVTNADDFIRIVTGLKSGDSMALLVQRGPDTFYAAIAVP